MKAFSLLLLLISVFYFQSCQIDAVTHFNKDFSGTSSTTIDLSQLIDFASGFSDDSSEDKDEMAALDSIFMFLDGSVKNDSVAMFMDSLQVAFSEAGMNNLSFDREGDHGLKLSFDFNDLDVFNGQDVMNKIGESFGDTKVGNEYGNDMFGSMPNSTTITRKGKWLSIDLFGMTYNEFKKQLREEMESEAEEAYNEDEIEESINMTMGMMDMMGDMYEFNSTYTFDRKIKEIESPFAYKSDKHSLTINYNIGDVFETLKENGNAVIKVKLK